MTWRACRPTGAKRRPSLKVLGDALDILGEAGRGERRFHLVGHDRGGSLSWVIADRWPERLASLTMLSRPHPAAFRKKADREMGGSLC
jgi:pimeloyl-ACP methyl ester carboxylesterase